MDVVTEKTSNQDIRDEIEQLKKQAAQLQNQLEKDCEAHNKEIKKIREDIEYEKVLRKSLMDQAQAVAVSDSSADNGKTLSDNFKKVIEETKRQRWCATCLGKATYICCWNTAYCGTECQYKHWPQHRNQCQQPRNANNGTSASASGTSAAAVSDK